MAAPLSHVGPLNKIHHWLLLHPRFLLVFAVLAALIPFLVKPFNMDDPLFIWAARQIHAHPGNPYDFDVNWYGTVTPMWEVTKNPPLACYYLAGAAGVFGWSELALHGAFLLPALAAILGTHRLARIFCGRPMLAALITLLTPAFLVSSTTVMCDVLMLALWVWAVVWWTKGIQRDNSWQLLGAGLLMALAALTKYYGACLVPLLATYGFIKNRRPGGWTIVLLIPLVTLCGYHFWTQKLYGRTLLSDAVSYAAFPNAISEFISMKAASTLTALAFMGGGLAVVAFLAVILWRPRQRTWLIAGSGLLAVVLLFVSGLLKNYGPIQGSSRLWIEIQIIAWAIGGVSVLGLAVADVWRCRDANAWLLALWVIGTFLFSALFNWTVNGRTILPMTPAVAILLVRRLERKSSTNGNIWPRGATVCLATGALLALLVVRADFLFATAVRGSARETHRKHGGGAARFLFQGHWGFQYYLDALGAAALDVQHTALKRGDLIATPENNSNFVPLGPELVVLREAITVTGPRWLTTMKGEVGAGFYAALRGPLPFAFGDVPPDRVVVCAVEPLTPPSAPGTIPP